MRNILVLLVLVLFGIKSQAQTFKVLKLQGKKAIVEFTDATGVQSNQTYSVGSGGDSSSSAAAGGKSASMNTGERKYGIGLNGTISSKKADTTGAEATTIISGQGRFVWNMKQFEVGPTLSVTSAKAGSAFEQTEFGIGAIGYYNFSPNQVGTESIISVVGLLEMVNQTNKTTVLSTTTETKQSEMNIYVGGSYRMFMLSSDHAIELQALYAMEKTTPDPGTATTTSGIDIRAGITTYF